MGMRKLTLIAVLLVVGGCNISKGAKPWQYKTMATDPRRDTNLAAELNAKGIELLKDHQYEPAEKKLLSALTADMFFGPAHNNLGMAYYYQKKYYLAAWEFQYAAKLMPGKAEPKNNLGMVMEAAGKLDEASKNYAEALQLEPDTVEIAANLARVYVRQNRRDDRTRELLHEVAMKDPRPEWVSWARERLAIVGHGSEPLTTQPAPKP